MAPRIGAASASDFDRAYIDGVVNEHRGTVKLYEEFSRSTKNADLKAFADNTLPGLRTHLKRAIDLLAVLGAAAAK